jgi:hypothetical protein
MQPSTSLSANILNFCGYSRNEPLSFCFGFAVVAVAVFLRWNGYRLQFTDREMYDWLMQLFEIGRVTKHALDISFREHVVPA